MEDDELEMMGDIFYDEYDSMISIYAPYYEDKLNPNDVFDKMLLMVKNGNNPYDAIRESIDECILEYNESVDERIWIEKENEATNRWLNNGGWYSCGMPVCL